ncbi:MAG: hypothetical protein WBA74_21000, partial [Cyclobacteriaceae bacterium]
MKNKFTYFYFFHIFNPLYRTLTILIMALSQLTEALGVKRAAHLLRRTCFGATKAQIDEFAALTPQQAVTRLFET